MSEATESSPICTVWGAASYASRGVEGSPGEKSGAREGSRVALAAALYGRSIQRILGSRSVKQVSLSRGESWQELNVPGDVFSGPCP